MRRTAAGQRAFTVVELAVVLFIIALLLGSAMFTLSAQQLQLARASTQRGLEQARDALLGFAVANGRLPCPAAPSATGVESEAASPALPGTCTNPFDGFLPGLTLGFQPVDAQGYALDAWNNRIRYAVASPTLAVNSCLSTSTLPHFTNKTNLKQNGMSCLPNANDLLVCQSTQVSPAPTPGSCGTGNAVTNTATLVAIVFSTGPNFVSPSSLPRPDEIENTDGDSVFISHVPQPEGAPGGQFDDMMLWIPVGTFYGRMAAAGVLP